MVEEQIENPMVAEVVLDNPKLVEFVEGQGPVGRKKPAESRQHFLREKLFRSKLLLRVI